MDIIIEKINFMFSNDFYRLYLLILCSIYAGYTLQPVPKWLNNMFNTSNIFKFFILICIGITAVYPIDKNKLINISLSSFIILVLFDIFRTFD